MAVREFILLNFVLPMADRIQGTCITTWYKHIKNMHNLDRAHVEAWQNNQLSKLIHHVYDHTTYYRKLFDELGLAPDDIKTIEDLSKLPIIDKRTATEHFSEIVPDNLSQFKYREGKTGGTTGEPMFYYCDEDTWGYVTANKIYNWKKSGYRYGDSFAVLGSSSLFSDKPSFRRRVYDALRREYGLNSVSLTDEKCANYIRFIKKKKIKYMNGYAASLYILAQYVNNHKIDIRLKAVFSTSENLTDSYRETIEKAFNCKVMDCYGARDAGITAYESSRHHYQIGYNAMAEIVDEIAPFTGSVLSTNLLNFTFPLLRYKFGDEAQLDGDAEGFNGQQFKQILGRSSDVLRMENGRSLSSTGFSMIMKHFDIVAFNFKKLEGCHVLLTIQPTDKYTQDQESAIKKTLAGYLGEDCCIDIDYVKHFDEHINGKRRYYYI